MSALGDDDRSSGGNLVVILPGVDVASDGFMLSRGQGCKPAMADEARPVRYDRPFCGQERH
jgi:hypothetical protein